MLIFLISSGWSAFSVVSPEISDKLTKESLMLSENLFIRLGELQAEGEIATEWVLLIGGTVRGVLGSVLTRRKYTRGRVSNLPVQLPPALQETALALISSARSHSSWKQSRTVERRLARMEQLHGVPFTELPWTAEIMAAFVAAGSQEGLAHTSVKCYLSQVRTLHNLNGFNPPGETSVVRWLLTGMANIRVREKRRIAISPSLLRILKLRLRSSNLEVKEKLLLWALFTCLFFGAFRVSELCSHAANQHGDTTLTWSDVQWSTEENHEEASLIFNLKSPKEVSGSGRVRVEIFGCQEANICPILAFRTWRRRSELQIVSQNPVFQFESGKNITGEYINKTLRKLLHADVDYDRLQVVWRYCVQICQNLFRCSPTVLGRGW